MFGVSHLPELLIVLVLALVVFGPKRLPEIGGALGKSIREFKDSTSDLGRHHEESNEPERAQIPTRTVDTVPPKEDVAAAAEQPAPAG